MPSAAPANPIIDEALPPDLVEAGVYATGADGFEHSLVVLAMGRACWLVEAPAGCRLLVEPEAFAPAREQLARYDRERVGWPPRPVAEPVTHGTDLITPLLWAAAVLAVFRLQGGHPGWIAAGALEAAAIFERGEWWRAGTALFLHADAGHVVSNAMIGLIVFTAVLKTLGRAAGWLLLAAASLAGNLAIAAASYPAAYRSLGASTAIFAGVGLLTGRALRVVARTENPRRWRAMLAALGSGVVVLALYGAGGLAIDLGAHVAGFVAGLALGFVAAGCSAGRAAAR
jgi:membrane associated rhomboid family serine protease